MPIALTAEDENGAHQHVSGMDDRGLQQFADQLQAVQSQDTAGNWANLVQWSGKGGDRKPVRILAPHQLMLIRNDQFKGYWEPYVDQVWAHIAAQGITVNTQSDAGDIKGHIEGDPTSVGSMLVFDDGSRFTKPRSIDCFASGSVDGQGPWVEGGSPFSAGDPKTSQRAKIIPRLCAAFARTLFMFSQDQPGSLKPDQYYQAYPTNLYAEICHHLNLDHKGYAFAYDDVSEAFNRRPVVARS